MSEINDIGCTCGKAPPGEAHPSCPLHGYRCEEEKTHPDNTFSIIVTEKDDSVIAEMLLSGFGVSTAKELVDFVTSKFPKKKIKHSGSFSI